MSTCHLQYGMRKISETHGECASGSWHSTDWSNSANCSHSFVLTYLCTFPIPFLVLALTCSALIHDLDRP